MKKVVTIKKLEDCPPNEDLDYWLSRPVEERLAEVERLRRLMHGHSDRLERVIRIVRLGEE